MNKYVILIIILTWNIACSFGKKNIKSNFTLKQDKTGIVVFSVTMSECRRSVFRDGFSISFRNRISGDTDFVKLKILENPEELNPLRKVFFIELEPGEFNFYELYGFQYYGTQINDRDERLPINIEFKVMAGKATYIGNLDVKIFEKDFNVEIKDHSEKDWAAEKS